VGVDQQLSKRYEFRGDPGGKPEEEKMRTAAVRPAQSSHLHPRFASLHFLAGAP
jgi:hypothetical protein